MNALKVRDKHRTADMEVVAEQTRTERAERVEHTAGIAQLEGDLQELKEKLGSAERRNNVADLRYAMLRNECELLRREIVSCGVCSGEMVRRLVNASKDVDASIDDLNRLASHAQKAARDMFVNKSVA